MVPEQEVTVSDAPAWQEFLAGLPGKPLSVVCDRDLGIIGAVQRHWSRGKSAVPIHLWAYHLLEKARQALRRDGIGREHPTCALLHKSLQARAGWDAFEDSVRTDPAAEDGQRWVKHWHLRLRTQTARWPDLPPMYGNGAIEAPIARVRGVLEARRWTLRNRARMNLLLELVRLADLRADTAGVYVTGVRRYLIDHRGHPPRTYREVYDTWGPTEGQTRVYSLWASDAEKVARELRSAERRKTGRPPKGSGPACTSVPPDAEPVAVDF